MTSSATHTPVLLERCLELLAPVLGQPGAVLVDATIGLAGHAEAFLTRFPDVFLIGFDRDSLALARAEKRLEAFSGRFALVHCVYDQLKTQLDELGYNTVSAVLFDLGVSSMQLDLPERGFSYSQDAPLDMRMDQTSALTAEQILAEYSESELRRIFWEYGEERLAAKYAKRIVDKRATEKLSRSSQLVRLITEATPASLARKGHPAKRVFQALRIEVNGELAALALAIPQAIDALNLGGRLVVLSYQSLEDRIVKRALATATTSSAPRDLPVELAHHRPQLRLLVRGAELASSEEKSANPRSIPVRLRSAERVRKAS